MSQRWFHSIVTLKTAQSSWSISICIRLLIWSTVMTNNLYFLWLSMLDIDWQHSAESQLIAIVINVCRKLCISWHSFLRLSYISFVWEIRKFNFIILQLLKIEAIQITLFVDVSNAFSAMIDSLSAAIRFRIVRLLLLHWQSLVIIKKVHCCSRTMYSIRENIFMYSSLFKSQFRLKEISCKMFKTAENNLIVYLEEQSWIMQKEMIWYIWQKWNINVHQFMISRILKRRRWSNKKEQRVEVRQNDELRLNWVADMLRLMIKQLVFMNESLFNEITNWRHQVYVFVDQSARYQVSRTREHCWSVLSIYTKDEYLFCIDIREDWFNDETFFRWLADELLSLCSFFSTSRSVIIMNNTSVHCNSRIEELIILHECQISYLSCWVDDLSLIMSDVIFVSLLVELQSHRTHL